MSAIVNPTVKGVGERSEGYSEMRDLPLHQRDSDREISLTSSCQFYQEFHETQTRL